MSESRRSERKNTQYGGMINDVIRFDNCKEGEIEPISWRGIKKVPVGRWDDNIEKTEDKQ